MLKTKKTKKMLEIEELAGTDIKEFLTELYIKKNMTLWDMVDYLKTKYEISITIGGLSRWFLKLDIPTREWRLPEEKAS